ncbi:uncharacterized protein LOC125465255 [Stegostoma tigrinum]|uniref:uncharacterized protein LOC125465255 n=1 Tax=Stegostoma tigrinum TaxID=3053191 RepID=UPI0028709E12|nr:uncharacterized protein LOC125465255 [Stegostoma tigrinum]
MYTSVLDSINAIDINNLNEESECSVASKTTSRLLRFERIFVVRVLLGGVGVFDKLSDLTFWYDVPTWCRTSSCAGAVAGTPFIAPRNCHSRLALTALRSCRKSAGCRSQRPRRRLRSHTNGVQCICVGRTESCACAQRRTPDNNGVTVGHVLPAAGALSRAGRLDPGAAMKWCGPFRLLLMLWLTAPSGQRAVPARAPPSPVESTQSDGDTASLIIEVDEEAGHISTTPGLSSPAVQSNGGASPLKIEIDMEESTENGIGQSTADATEPVWHPYLIKISSGTGTATATATTTSSTSTSPSPEPEVPPAASLMEETIVMQLPEPNPEIVSSTLPPPLLIIEELTPSSPSERGSLLLLESPTESILVLDEKEQKLKSKKHLLGEVEGKAPPHKQKGSLPPKKQKSKSHIEAGSQPPPIDHTAGDKETKSPHVLFLVEEVDQNPSTIQQHELPVAVQIISGNATVPGISIQEVDSVTRGDDISVEDVNTIANSADIIVSKVSGNAVEYLGTSSSAPVVSGVDRDTTTTCHDTIVTKVPNNTIEDLGSSSSAVIISGTDINAVNKTSDIIITSVPVTGVEDTSTNSSAVIINGTVTDTITKTAGTDIQETINSSHVPVTIIDTESNTKAPVTSVQESVTSTDVPVVITIIDTNSKAPVTNVQEFVTSTHFEDNIPVTDTNSKAQSTTVQEVVTGTTNASVINVTSTDTNSKISGTRTLDLVTNTSAPVIDVTETNTVTEVPAVSVQDANTSIVVSVIGVSETKSATKTPATILTAQGPTHNDEMDSEVEDTFVDISDKRISVTNVMDKITVPEPHFKEMYFDQLVDHFSFTAHQKLYRQRYLLSDQFWSKSFGPIFLYTGNEGDIWDFANSSRFVIELASEQQALVIFAEHRYYGKSLPFGKKSYERSNMEFLTVEQTLADYVVLITKLKTDLDAKSCAVIAFGGSYGGMLSAYMRIKYPNVVDGALASSAPVVSTANLGDSRQFFHDVTKGFERNSPECVLTIRKGFQELEFLAQQQAWSKITNKLSLCKAVKSKKDVDHLYGWARNAFTYLAMFNYPYKTEVGIHFPPNPVDVACRYVLKRSDHIEGLLDILGIFYNSTGRKRCFDIYSEYIHCSDPTGCGSGSASQAWDFQACTEINLLYESNNDTDMFPVIPFTEAMRRNYCHSKWGVYPNSQWLKIQYWGDDYKAASNIIFSNGDLDPWANGGILKTMNPSVITFVIEGAAHHLDLRASNVADPPSVTVVRKMESSIIREWVKSSQLRYV